MHKPDDEDTNDTESRPNPRSRAREAAEIKAIEDAVQIELDEATPVDMTASVDPASQSASAPTPTLVTAPHSTAMPSNAPGDKVHAAVMPEDDSQEGGEVVSQEGGVTMSNDILYPTHSPENTPAISPVQEGVQPEQSPNQEGAQTFPRRSERLRGQATISSVDRIDHVDDLLAMALAEVILQRSVRGVNRPDNGFVMAVSVKAKTHKWTDK